MFGLEIVDPSLSIKEKSLLVYIIIIFMFIAVSYIIAILSTNNCIYIGFKEQNNETIIVFFNQTDSFNGKIMIINTTLQNAVNEVLKSLNATQYKVVHDNRGFDYLIKVCKTETSG